MAIKRFFDLGLALLLLPVLTPLFLLIALLVRYNLGSPVLFVQKRLGDLLLSKKVYMLPSY